MNIARLSVNKPVTTIMIFVGIILLGVISWGKLPQELFPSITYPQITIVTGYANAAPEEIESLITRVIEEAVGTVNNVKRVSSISREGFSLVMAEFNWGTNMDFAALNVREKIDLIKERLPRESQEPVVMKYNPFDLPVMNLSVTGPASLSPLELREICRKYVKDAIEKVDGVASATITGGDEREILVEIDQPRLRASQISIVSVIDSIKTANLNYPAGTIKESFYEFLIRTMGEYKKIEEIKETPAALDVPEEQAKTMQEKEEKEKQARRLVYLRDIAKVKDTIKEKTSISRYNGKDSISIVVRKQSGANSLSVARGVSREIRRVLAEKLPKGISIQTTYDQSQFIRESLGNLRDAAVQGSILSFLVLFIFLWELKSSLIIILAIPICIAATAILMYFCNITLNMMSLGGLAMGVGMVVDNANVVIENIFRNREQLKKGLKDASIDGTNEMTAAIVGSTLTNIAVFLPFAFVVGVVGQIFKQLSLTITFSLIVSIIVALSLVPVLICIRTRGGSGGGGWMDSLLLFLDRPKAKAKEAMENMHLAFGNFIAGILEHKKKVIGIVLVLFALSLIVIGTATKQFLPRVDQRQFIIKVDLPPGMRLEVTDSVVRKIEHLLLNLPETKDVTVNIGSGEEKGSTESSNIQSLGSNQAQIMVNLKKKSKYARRSTEEVIQYLKNMLEGKNMEDAIIEYIAQETSFGTALEQGAPIAIEIKGNDLNRLTDLSSLIQANLNKVNGIYGTKSSMPLPSPETKLNILKDKASLYGLSVRDIAITAQAALKGYVATRFKEKAGQEDVDIRVRLRSEDRSDMGNLRRLLIHSPMGMDISLSDVAYLTKGRGPTEIKRVDQQRSIVITANTYQRNFNRIIKDVNRILAYVKSTTTKDYSIELTGEQERMKESFKSLAFALLLAFALVYMIMAAEFESLWQPFLIMFTIPLSLIGVAFALLVTQTPLSAVVYLGIIMLGGIAVNNGIVLIDFVNVLRKEGRSPHEAVIEASKTRLRPILMTSLTTILGLLPIAIGLGEGAELQAPLAITVMGGLTSSTFLTLVFIPALYLAMVGRLERESLTIESGEEIEKESVAPPPPIELPKEVAPREEPAPKPVTIYLSPAKPEEITHHEPPAEPLIPPLENIITPISPAPIPEPPAPEPPATPLMPEPIIPLSLPPQGPALSAAKKEEPKEELNPRQKELLEKLKDLKRITRKEYAQLFRISVPTASRDLKELVDKNILKAQGPLGPGRWYELA